MAEILYPPDYTEADVHAVRACILGQASPDQQQRAMRWIGEQCARRLDSPYDPAADAVALGVLIGRHMVGVWISNMTTAGTLDLARRKDAEKAGQQPTAGGSMILPTPRRRKKRGEP